MIGAMMGEPLGREHEVDSLDAFLDLPDEKLTAAMLVGDPRIGKSTLWERTLEAAELRSMTILSSRPAETERGLAHPAWSIQGRLRGRDPPRLTRWARPAS